MGLCLSPIDGDFLDGLFMGLPVYHFNEFVIGWWIIMDRFFLMGDEMMGSQYGSFLDDVII